jgi:hypothetical protein
MTTQLEQKPIKKHPPKTTTASKDKKHATASIKQ